jgi:hypothetical protein
MECDLEQFYVLDHRKLFAVFRGDPMRRVIAALRRARRNASSVRFSLARLMGLAV